MKNLDEKETGELIDELNLRLDIELPQITTLEEETKMRNFCRVFDKYSSQEIETILNK